MDAELRSGKSIALYHTAGKGTRLAPLPGAENNNKPGVKIPATVAINGKPVAITILESVIIQTGCYAKSRPGRLSVFWGDQIFVPKTVDVNYTVTHHVDILCSLGPMLSEADWRAKGMDKYGLIAVGDKGEAAQVEKVSHATATELLRGLGQITAVGVSLGSFSVSSAILFTLLSEFRAELDSKKGKLDSDPHLWMPMTLDRTAYIQLMTQKKQSEEVSGQHYDRIAAMMGRFKEAPSSGSLGLFGPVDVGQGVYWWDYGQLKLYQQNTLLMALDTPEAALMRSFYRIPEGARPSDLGSNVENTTVDGCSPVSNCTLGAGEGPAGHITNSVLCGVKCKYIEADGCVLINVTAKKIVAQKGSIVYNVFDSSEEGLVVEAGDVLAGVLVPMVLRSRITIDGGEYWEKEIPAEVRTAFGGDSPRKQLTFAEMYDANSEVCPLNVERAAAGAHDAAWERF